MFIAQIKAPIHHPASVCAVLCSLAGCLKLQTLTAALSQTPAVVSGRETKLSNARACFKSCCSIKQTSHRDNIRSRG